MRHTTLLVDLDALLDTRFSLLSTTFPDRIEDLMSFYFSRKTNDFRDIIGYKDFNELYRKRDRSVLSNAVMSKSMLMLQDFVADCLENMVHMGLDIPPKILLNIFPYQLDQKEIKEIVVSILFHVGTKVDIEVVFYDPKLITPSFLARDIWGYMTFDYYNWLDDIAPHLKSNAERCPDVKIITPSYLPVLEKDLSTLFFHNGKQIDPFHYFKIGMSYIIDIEFVAPSTFNRLWHIEAPETTDEPEDQNS